MLNISNKRSGQDHLYALPLQDMESYISKVFESFLRVCRSFPVHGSLTIEAALGLPLLLFFMLMVFTPIHVMDEQRHIQNAMEAAAKDMSVRAYIEGLSEELVSDSELKKDIVGTLFMGMEMLDIIGLIKDLKLDSIKDISLGENHLTGLDITEGSYTEEESEKATSDEMVFFELKYKIKWPISLFDTGSYSLSSIVNRRKWIGSEGGRGRDKFGEGLKKDGYDIDEEGDPIVYVGKTATRYHVDRHCHYIDNVMSAVAGEDIEELRNSSGGRYHACPSCDARPEGTVYIFESGTSYHSSEECKSIGSYARVCKLSEVEHLGPCSYCGGGRS